MRRKMNWTQLIRRYDNGGANPTDVPAPEPNSQQSEYNSGADNAAPEPKMFTQDEVNRMMAREKKQGRAAVLNELGVDNIDTAKNNLAEYNKLLDAQKTDAQKAAEEHLKLSQDLIEAKKAQQLAEAKVQLLVEGCNSSMIDEALVLALSKVDENTTYEEAIKQVKEKLPALFTNAESTETPNNQGTGGSVGHNRSKPSTSGSLGSRLAKAAAANETEKNPYFSRN